MAEPIDEMIRRLRTIPERVRGHLPEAAREVRAVFVTNVAAQRGPDGTLWPKTEDGHAALKNAGAAIGAQVVGGTLLFTLDGVEARHSVGAVKGGKKRPILPASRGPMPPAVAEALKGVFAKAVVR